jgi:hypothetical protein
MTNAEVKTAYEANADTNEFSDAEQTKLAGIASGADNVGTGTAGQVLKTNSGATGIEWGADGGLPSGGTVGQVVTNTAAGAGNWADAAGGGKVLQVIQAVKTDRGSWSGAWQTINGWAATITPSSTSSKILVSISVGSATPVSTRNSLGFRIMRGSTPIAIGDAVGTCPRLTFRTTLTGTDSNHSDGGFQTQVLDSPSTTSAITYTLQGNAEGDGAFYVNRNEANTTGTQIYKGTTHSSIILMEIGA